MVQRFGDVSGWTWTLFGYQCGILARGEVIPPQDDIAANINQPDVPSEIFNTIFKGEPFLIPWCKPTTSQLTVVLDFGPLLGRETSGQSL